MMKRRAKVDYARWVFVLPALLVVGILLIYPIFSSLYYSMTTKHLIRLTYDFIGLENYKAVLADPNFFKAFLNSVLWTLGSLAGQLIIGFTGALAINRVNFGKGIYRTLMIIPWAFPSIVIALSWKWILNGVSGFIPNILVQLGICNELPQFLSDNSFVFLTLIFAHQGEAFGDEDDMLFVNMQFSDNRYAVLEWGSAFHWPEHYVLIQGTKGAIKIDMCDCGGTLKIDGKDEHFLVHESQEEDDDRTRIYHSTEMDGAIMYGKPGKKPPMWLHSIMKNEMKYLNGILHGKEVDEEFRPLLTGEAARAAIATADACTRSRFEDRKVKLSEIIG